MFRVRAHSGRSCSLANVEVFGHVSIKGERVSDADELGDGRGRWTSAAFGSLYRHSPRTVLYACVHVGRLRHT